MREELLPTADDFKGFLIALVAALTIFGFVAVSAFRIARWFTGDKKT
jgi:hypothetical protein